jgi:ABC-type glycerol-3-phosphate transport system substrate-binding protein
MRRVNRATDVSEIEPEMMSRIEQREGRPEIMIFRGFLLIALTLCPGYLFAQSRAAMTISELVTYTGKDREQMLYTGAKAEGKVTWYTSLAGDSYKAMIKAFEGKYSGVKVEAYRTNGVAQK